MLCDYEGSQKLLRNNGFNGGFNSVCLLFWFIFLFVLKLLGSVCTCERGREGVDLVHAFT